MSFLDNVFNKGESSEKNVDTPVTLAQPSTNVFDELDSEEKLMATQNQPVATSQESTPNNQDTTKPPIEENSNERVVKQNYWEKPDKIKENFKSFDQAMSDEDAKRYGKFQDAPKSNDVGSLSQEGKQALSDQDAISKDLKGQNFSSSLSEIMPQDEANRFKKDELHQDALDSNKKANEGFKPLKPMSDNGKDFFARQDQIAQDAKRDALHQEALDSNKEANEGFNNLKPMSDNGKDFFARQDEIAEKAKRDALHQEALDSNRKANEGFPANAPLSNTGRTFFANEDIYKEKAKADDEITSLHNELDSLREEIAALREAIRKLTEPEPTPEPEPEPTPEPTPEPEPEPTPEPTPEPEPNPEENDRDRERRERNIRRAKIIAGVAGGVTGVGTGLMIASTAALPVGAALIGANILTSGTDYVLRRNSQSLARRIEAETDQARKEVLERRLNRVNKIRTGIGYVQPFIRGFMVGFGGSLAFRSLFMGGQSIIEQMGATQGTENIATTTHADAVAQSNAPETPLSGGSSAENITNVGGGSETLMSPEPLTENVLTSNGRVDLPGSAWNGNLANAPAGDLPGGIANHSNFVGGVHEMAPHLAETALQNAGITRSALLENLGTSGTHRLLNSFVDAIQMGNPNPSLVDILSKINTPGAQNLISMIK